MATTVEEKPERTTAPLLDLSKTEREVVKLRDGSQRELKNLNEFGITEQHKLRRQGQEFDKLWEQDGELSDDDKSRITFLLNELFERLVLAPESVKKKVKEGDRAQVVLIFTSAPYATLLAMARAQAEEAETETETSES